MPQDLPRPGWWVGGRYSNELPGFKAMTVRLGGFEDSQSTSEPDFTDKAGQALGLGLRWFLDSSPNFNGQVASRRAHICHRTPGRQH